MTTRLTTPLKREIDIAGDAHTLTITPEGLNLVRKGKRKGYRLAWSDFVSGEAALAAALNASVEPKRAATRSRRTGPTDH